MDEGDSDDYDEAPQRFRSINEVYQHSHEVALESDSDEQENAENADSEEQAEVDAVEVTALLTMMEEPSKFQ
jgi:hypothetical protein